MPLQTFSINGQNVEIDADQALLDIVGNLISQNAELTTKLDSTPSLSDQLKLWEKAKPYFEANNTEINYDLSPIEVMRTCLGFKEFENVSEQDEKTVSYLFNNVLPAYKAPVDQETPTAPTTSIDKTKTTTIKVSGKGLTSQQLAGKIAENRKKQAETS